MKKRMQILWVFLGMMVFLGACASDRKSKAQDTVLENGTEASADNTETVKLRWALFDWAGDLEKSQDNVNRVFEEQGLPFAVEFVNISAGREAVYDGDYGAYVKAYVDAVKSGDYDLAGCGGRIGGCYDAYEIMAEEGLLLPLEDWMETEEAGQKLKDAYPSAAWEALSRKSHIYGVEVPLTDLRYYAVFCVNYADKYDIDVDAVTFLEMDRILQQTAKGEWQAGNQDFIASTDWPAFLWGDYECSSCELICIDTAEDVPKAGSILETEAYLSHLERLERWREEGLLKLVPDQAQMQKGNFLVTGLYSYSEEAAENVCRSLYGIPPEVRLEAVELPEFRMAYLGRGEKTGVLASGSHKEEARKVLAAVCSDEKLSNALIYGAEGRDYEIKDGKVMLLNENETGLFVRQTSFGNPFLTIPAASDSEARTEELWEEMEDLEPLADIRVVYSSEMKETILKLNLLWQEYQILRLEGGAGDWDRTLEELKKEAELLGIREIVDEMNCQFEGVEENGGL